MILKWIQCQFAQKLNSTHDDKEGSIRNIAIQAIEMDIVDVRVLLEPIDIIIDDPETQIGFVCSIGSVEFSKQWQVIAGNFSQFISHFN